MMTIRQSTLHRHRIQQQREQELQNCFATVFAVALEGNFK